MTPEERAIQYAKIFIASIFGGAVIELLYKILQKL